MAKPNSTEKVKRVTMRVDEVHNLADRLQSRGVSKLSGTEPEQQRDLRTAAKIIRELLRNVNRSDVVTIDNGDYA